MDENLRSMIERYSSEAMEYAMRGGLRGGVTVRTGDSDLNDNVYEDFVYRRPATGNLRVQLSSAFGSFPIESGAVEVYRDFGGDKRVFYKKTTDSSGIADNMPLPAFPNDYSQTPESAVQSATEYMVSVYHPDYTAVDAVPIKIYSNIETLLPITLQPTVN